jgi:apolipoprotein N-acyltransferase
MIAHNHSGWAVKVGTAQGRALIAAYAREIRRLPKGTDVAVLPEGAFGPKSRREADAVVRPMTRAAHQRNVDVVVAFNRLAGKARYNTAVAIPGDGGEPKSYLKHHDTVSRLGRTLTFVPGSGGRAGLEICADVNFPQPSRDYANAGAKLLLVPASDNGENGEQHSRTGLLRAVENGQSLAVSDRDGTSMAVDGTGHILAKARTHGPAAFTTITAKVPDGPGGTLYSRYGDWYAWLCIALGLGGLAASWLPTRARTRPQMRTGRIPPATVAAGSTGPGGN